MCDDIAVNSLFLRPFQTLPRGLSVRCHPVGRRGKPHVNGPVVTLALSNVPFDSINKSNVKTTHSVSLGSCDSTSSSLSRHTLQAGGALGSSRARRSNGSLSYNQERTIKSNVFMSASFL